MVEGLDSAVIGMCAGEKRIIKITPDVGYGEKRRGIIPANSDLIYDVELISIN